VVAKLNIPDYDSLQVVSDIIEERSHYLDFYSSIQADWLSQVSNYIDLGGDPNAVPPLNLQAYLSQESIIAEGEAEAKSGESPDPAVRLANKRKKSLIGLYSPKEHKLPYDILEVMRRDHSLLFCPSCGEPGKPGTLDHYLPKKIYPELSIVTANLTPMCSECQGRKGSDITDSNGNKIFIHPYFDPIDQVIISLLISVPYSSPASFTIMIPSDVDEPFFSLVERHITGVDFRERFEEFCQGQYIVLLSTFYDERQDDEPDSARRIVSRFLKSVERQSMNRWEAVFYRGVLANDNLLDYLDNGNLPEYL